MTKYATDKTRDASRYRIAVRHYFGNEHRFTRLIWARDWRSVLSYVTSRAPHDAGWGRKLVMTERTALAVGAYETASGAWVLTGCDDAARVAVAEGVDIVTQQEFAAIRRNERVEP